MQWIILIALLVIAALWVASIRFETKRTLLRRLTAVPGLVIVAFVVGIVAGMPIIPGNAQRYATILETADGDFATDIQEVDYSEVPIIDRDSAILLGARAMGTIPEYVSQFEISTAYSQISYQGRPVRVSPLVYADLFKWFTNRSEGIPAYVLVDMTTQEAQVVRLEEPIKYSESEPLARNIDRYVQLKYPTYMFDEKSFELDEEGTPWWVFPVQKRTIGLFDGTTIQRVVLVNACTGETQDYAIEDCPDWVDRAYPSDLLIQQYNWSGMYSGGWLNSWLGQRDVVRTTQGTNGSLGYNYITQDGDLYLYTGVSSVTADNSIIGFILVNQRTARRRSTRWRAPPRTPPCPRRRVPCRTCATRPHSRCCSTSRASLRISWRSRMPPVGQDVRDDQHPAVPERCHGRHGGGVPGQLHRDACHKRDA